MNKKQKKMLFRIILSVIFLIFASVIPANGILKFLLYLIPYFIIGHDILEKAFHGIINLQPFDENFLMAVATAGAMILGEHMEGVAVMLFYQIGELFQSIATSKSRKNISSLMDIRPDKANLLLDDGNIREVHPDEVEIASVIVIKPGEKVPVDGVVVEGSTSLDTSALTGESIPREAEIGSEVLSGAINISGLIKVRTTKSFGESTASKILELVENAASNKSKSENFITKFAKFYTPIVCFCALALAVIPPVLGLALSANAEWSKWIYRSLTFLVISCPCALVISIPLSFFASLGGASSEGILIKGSNFIESLAGTKYVVFDKTGTLTKGVFEAVEICPNNTESEKLLEYAAYAESFSTHPIAQSITKRFSSPIDKSRISDICEISGKGIKAVIDGKTVLVGKTSLLESFGIDVTGGKKDSTTVHIAVDGAYYGYILVSDVIKESSKPAVDALKKAGIKKTVMLTGDSTATALAVAEEIGIDEVHANLLPQNKVELVENLICSKPEAEKLIFVGDGINDAPVLSRADVGIAMGGIGSDAAIEAADVVLMDDDPAKISKAIKISKKCMAVVYQNTVFAIGTKFLCLILVSLGYAGMWFGIFADVGVMVLAVLNAIRTFNVKRL